MVDNIIDILTTYNQNKSVVEVVISGENRVTLPDILKIMTAGIVSVIRTIPETGVGDYTESDMIMIVQNSLEELFTDATVDISFENLNT